MGLHWLGGTRDSRLTEMQSGCLGCCALRREARDSDTSIVSGSGFADTLNDIPARGTGVEVPNHKAWST